MYGFEDDIEEWLGDISKKEVIEVLKDEKKMRKLSRDYLSELRNDPSFDYYMKNTLEKMARCKGIEVEEYSGKEKES